MENNQEKKDEFAGAQTGGVLGGLTGFGLMASKEWSGTEGIPLQFRIMLSTISGIIGAGGIGAIGAGIGAGVDTIKNYVSKRSQLKEDQENNQTPHYNDGDKAYKSTLKRVALTSLAAVVIAVGAYKIINTHQNSTTEKKKVEVYNRNGLAVVNLDNLTKIAHQNKDGLMIGYCKNLSGRGFEGNSTVAYKGRSTFQIANQGNTKVLEERFPPQVRESLESLRNYR